MGSKDKRREGKHKKEKKEKREKKETKERQRGKEKRGHKEKRRRSSSRSSSSSSDSDGGAPRLTVNKQLAMGRAAARATREILAYNADLRKELREVCAGGCGC